FFLTSDGGTTWTAGGSLGITTRVWKILPIDATTLLCATNQGLYRSTDGGHSFTQIAINGQTATDPTGFQEVHSLARFTDGTLALFRWSITDPGGKFWFSADNGLTWTGAVVNGAPATVFGRATFAAAPASAVGWALAANTNRALYPGLFKTVDS